MVRSEMSSRSNSARAAKIPKTSFPEAVVDSGALTGEDLQADAALGQVVDDVDQMAQVPAEPVELPDHEGVAVAEGFEARGQVRPVILLPGGPVFVEGICVDAGGHERVALQVCGLGTVGLGDAHVSDQHRSSSLSFIRSFK